MKRRPNAGPRERPILFSGRLVRAIREGRKTQTRRVIRPEWWRCLDPDNKDDRARAAAEQCPYGTVGDRLWVRETWARIWTDDCSCHDEDRGERRDPSLGLCPHEHVEYRADTGARFPGQWPEDMGDDPNCPRWRPSIHMPRWASRLDLEIEAIRIERLQQISHADALAEGAGHDEDWRSSPKAHFSALWDSINGDRGFGWATNPWVWVLTFKVAQVKR